MKDFIHVSIGRGGGLLRSAAVLTRIQIRRVPIPPVMFGMRLFVPAVVLFRFVKELGEFGYVHRFWSLRLPFAAGKSRRDFLQQPSVPVRIFERGKRSVGPMLPRKSSR